jgi:zinc and cadmium transporter
LLPELQFHDHDRVKLSAALLLGLALSVGVGRLESLVHRHNSNRLPSHGGVSSGEGEDGTSSAANADGDVTSTPAD